MAYFMPMTYKSSHAIIVSSKIMRKPKKPFHSLIYSALWSGFFATRNSQEVWGMAKRSIQSYSRTSGSGPGLDNRGKTDLGQPPRRVNCDQNWPSHIHLTRNFSITHSSHAKRLYHTSITRRKTFITHPCDSICCRTFSCGSTFVWRFHAKANFYVGKAQSLGHSN